MWERPCDLPECCGLQELLYMNNMSGASQRISMMLLAKPLTCGDDLKPLYYCCVIAAVKAHRDRRMYPQPHISYIHILYVVVHRLDSGWWIISA